MADNNNNESDTELAPYNAAVNSMAEEAAAKYDRADDSKELADMVRAVMDLSEWYTAKPVETIQNTSQNPDDLPYTPPWHTNINFGNADHLRWDHICSEVAYICLFNDILLKAEDTISSTIEN